ncbi:MAG: PQQ-like beta-propeller repeat protein [Phycisphaerales bacterium]|nr:PQQ-like beta-propeller repeat protein [Phycisphaerales bacterium]MCB9856572.1 PQQ-like beta-propeller repeat protein [Phycisphaerales bacterium]MCB9864631.1 PQQ-like beta-propeller repeat protein [Phycisphaerales bacterium]
MHLIAIRRWATTLAAIAFVLAADTTRADDWPQWMGPTRDGTYRETGIVDRIPDAGLPVKWRVPLAGGYSGPAVVNGRVYVMDYVVKSGDVVNEPQQKVNLEGQERVLCLDAKTGKTIWTYEYPCKYNISYPGGPRCTPTVVGDKLITLGAQGDLRVLSTKDGSVIWKKSFASDFNASAPLWGFAGHPLVVDDMVVALVGGEGQAVVAFDLATGDVKWKALSSSDAGYCPPIIIDAGGARQLIVWHPEAVASLNPKDGAVYWTFPLKPDFGMSIGRPQLQGDKLFIAGVMRTSLMLELDSKKPAARELWRGESAKSLYPGNVTNMWGDGVILGCDHGDGCLMAIDARDGKRLWETFDPVRPDEKRRIRAGSAFLTYHQPSGAYLLFGETGNLSLAELDRNGYHAKGRMHVLEPTTTAFGRNVVWSYPAYADRTAFIRNDKELVAVDIARHETALNQ